MSAATWAAALLPQPHRGMGGTLDPIGGDPARWHTSLTRHGVIIDRSTRALKATMRGES